jgi:hypothetical protein
MAGSEFNESAYLLGFCDPRISASIVRAHIPHSAKTTNTFYFNEAYDFQFLFHYRLSNYPIHELSRSRGQSIFPFLLNTLLLLIPQGFFQDYQILVK